MRSDIAQGSRHVPLRRLRAQLAARSDSSDSQQIGRILVDPRDPNVVLVAALGHPYGANEMRGVFRSTDGGRTWQRTLYRDADTGAIDLASEPGRPERRLRRAVADAPAAVERLPALERARQRALQVARTAATPGRSSRATACPNVPAASGSPSRPRCRSASSRSSTRTTAGSTAPTMPARAGAGKRGRAHLEARLVFRRCHRRPAQRRRGLRLRYRAYRSTDGGQHFVPVKGAPGGDDYHQLWIDPHDPARRILGVDQGAVVTLNGGATWSSWYNQPTGQFYHVDHRQPLPVLGLRRAAGLGRGGHSEPHRQHRRHQSQAVPRDRRRRRERQHRARPGRSRDHLRRARRQARPAHRPEAERRRRRSPTPTSTAAPGRCRSLSASRAATRCTSATSAYSAPPIAAGTGSAVSPDLTREHPAIPAELSIAATAADSERAGARRGVVYAIAPSPLDARLDLGGHR